MPGSSDKQPLSESIPMDCRGLASNAAIAIAAFEAKPLQSIGIDSDKGCLSDEPGISSPLYHLTSSEREAITNSITQIENLSNPLDARQQVLMSTC